MKRRWTTEEYRLRQWRRFRKAERRRLAPDNPQPTIDGRGARPSLVAPANLSVFDNPEETLAFCEEFRRALAPRNVRISLDLGGVNRISSDALLLMRALMRGKGWRTNVGGNLPNNPEVAAKLKASGFFVGFAKPPAELPPAKGLMLSKTSQRVYSETAAGLVRFAMANAKVDRPIAIASSNTLVEAMTNTHNHSGAVSRGRGSQHRRAVYPWFAGVYCEDGVASFTFVDLGVGILRSQHPRDFLKLIGLNIDLYGRVKLLQAVFTGLVGSTTGDPGRGNGLPNMKMDAELGLLPHLQVATSSVIGDVANTNFRTIGSTLRGTMLRWRAGD